MTANELFCAALALFYENNSEVHQEFVKGLINILLAECFEVNNRMRRRAGKEELTEIPQIGDMLDPIPYEEMLVRLALPYGLAAKLFFEEQDNPRLTYFLQEYAERVNRCDRWVVAF